jgi:hypothetical protein
MEDWPEYKILLTPYFYHSYALKLFYNEAQRDATDMKN